VAAEVEAVDFTGVEAVGLSAGVVAAGMAAGVVAAGMAAGVLEAGMAAWPTWGMVGVAMH
jgi:hypothetical protein